MRKDNFVGTWVDGGVLNNMPIQIFEALNYKDAGESTLGLRLDVEDLYLKEDKQAGPTTRNGATGLVAMLKAYLGLVFLGAGESHITGTWGTTEQSIQLPTTGLSTLDFSPSTTAAKESIGASKEAVAGYFSGK